MVVYDYDEPKPGQTIEDAQKEKAEKYRKEYEKYKKEYLEEVEKATEQMYADLRAKFAPKSPVYWRGGKKQRTRKNPKSKKVKKPKKVKKTMKYKKNNKR